VLTKVDQHSMYGFSMQEIEAFTDQYKIPRFHTNLSSEVMREQMANKILKLVEVANHYIPSVNALYLNSVHLLSLAET